MSHRLSRSSSRLARAAALAVLVLAAVVPVSADAATQASTLTGRVTLGGAPVNGVTITVNGAEDTGAERFARVTTRTDGTFTARFTTTSAERLEYHFWYDYDDPQHRIIAGRRDFVPRAGASVTRNAAVHSAGEITGYAKLPTGTDFSRLRIQVDGPDDGQANRGDDDNPRLVYPTTLKPRPSGFFRAWGLPPGDYSLTIVDPAQEYQPKCQDGTAPDFDTELQAETCAASVSITYGQKKTVPTQTLTTRSAIISGHVRDTTGHPIDLSRTYAVQAVDGQGRIEYANATAQGIYRFRGLPPGSWKVRADFSSDFEPDWESTYYGGDGTEADAEPVIVSNGGTATGVDLYLRARTRTYATVSPIAGGATFTVAVRRTKDGKPVRGDVVTVLDGKRRTVNLDANGRGTTTITGVGAGKKAWKAAYLGFTDDGASRVLGTVTVR